MNTKRYYLNNVTDAAITIQLTAKRTIDAKTSMPLNNKDVVVFKTLKAKRTGKVSMLNGLRLSTIPIEQDSNYVKPEGLTEEALKAELETRANEVLNRPENQSIKDFLEGNTEEVPEGTIEISEEETAKLEAQAMAELEVGMANDTPVEETPVEEVKPEEPTTEETSKQNKKAKNANK